MSGFVFVYITNPTEKEARRIARHLLEKRLIACANIYAGVSALYRWEGKVVDEKETILIAKTTEANVEKVREEVENIHPYETPCIVKVPVAPNRKFCEWLRGEVRG